MAEQKIGTGHLQAWLRTGAKEAAQVLPAFPTAPIQPVHEPGLIGNPTPQEVVEQKGSNQSYELMLAGYAQRDNSASTQRATTLDR